MARVGIIGLQNSGGHLLRLLIESDKIIKPIRCTPLSGLSRNIFTQRWSVFSSNKDIQFCNTIPETCRQSNIIILSLTSLQLTYTQHALMEYLDEYTPIIVDINDKSPNALSGILHKWDNLMFIINNPDTGNIKYIAKDKCHSNVMPYIFSDNMTELIKE